VRHDCTDHDEDRAGTCSSRAPDERPAQSCEVLLKKQDLAGIVLPKGQSPAMIFLPPCDFSHIPGGLDPVAPYAEDLEVIPGPLVPLHGDRPDVIQDVVMNYMQALSGVEFMKLLFAVGTLPSLLIIDKPPHFGNGGPLSAPVLSTAGGLAAQGIPVPEIEVNPLAATMGTGPPGEAPLLFRSIGIPAIFTGYHDQRSRSCPGRMP
jgi:hypothetical protein